MQRVLKMERTCFFIGHRDVGQQIIPYLRQAIERLVLQEQVSRFYVGGYGSFDRWTAECLCEMKAKYPNILLYRVIPYHPSVRAVEMPPGFDGTHYPEGMERVPPRYAILRANLLMVDHCDHLIACVYHRVGNACKVLEHAQKKEGLHIMNIGEWIKQQTFDAQRPHTV